MKMRAQKKFNRSQMIADKLSGRSAKGAKMIPNHGRPKNSNSPYGF
jgi:hypothetical protein